MKLNTTYSFGLDDQDFVVAFETEEPKDFLDLVMKLRETAEQQIHAARHADLHVRADADGEDAGSTFLEEEFTTEARRHGGVVLLNRRADARSALLLNSINRG